MIHWKWDRHTSLKMRWKRFLQGSPKLFWHHSSQLSQKHQKPYGEGLTHLRLSLHTWVSLNQWKLHRNQSVALDEVDLPCAQRMLTSDWQSDFYLFHTQLLITAAPFLFWDNHVNQSPAKKKYSLSVRIWHSFCRFLKNWYICHIPRAGIFHRSVSSLVLRLYELPGFY